MVWIKYLHFQVTLLRFTAFSHEKEKNRLKENFFIYKKLHSGVESIFFVKPILQKVSLKNPW